MTPAEAQRLFDTLGPRWRVFLRPRDPEEPPWMQGLSPRIQMGPNLDRGMLVVRWQVVDGNTVNEMRITEPEVVISTTLGSLLRADRDDGDVAEFSNVTLTPEMDRVLDEVFPPGSFSTEETLV